MKPLRLTAACYGPFSDLAVDLPLGAVAVIGPNGAGKSTLVNAIDRALFGSRSMGEWLTTGEVDGAMSLTLEFEHAGQLYRVRRGFSAKGRGKPSLDFEVYDGGSYDDSEEAGANGASRDAGAVRAGLSGGAVLDRRLAPTLRSDPSVAGRELSRAGTEADALGSWHPLTRESIKETQAEIERVLGFDRAIFRASAFLVQGGSGSFTDPGLDPRQRKQLLCDLLGLDVYDALLERVRGRMISIRDVTTRLSIQVEEAERELERKPEIQTSVTVYEEGVRDTGVELKRAEDDHRLVTEKLNASREVAAKLTAAREVLASRERELQTATARRSTLQESLKAADELPTLRANALTLAGRRESIEADLAAAREGEKARDEHRRLTAERDRIVAEADGFSDRVAQLREQAELLLSVREGATERCQLCDQVLGFEAATTSANKLHGQADALEVSAKDTATIAQSLIPAISDAAKSMADAPNAAKQAELENALRLANEAERTLAQVAEREKVVEELAVEFAQIEVRLPALQQSVAESTAEVEALRCQAPDTDLEAAVSRAYGVLHEARNDVEGAKGRLLVAQAELDRLSRIEANAKENRAALAEHQRELDVLLLAERAYGKAGIPAYILEARAIPMLEVKANEALAQLGGKTGSARIELRTQRAKKDGEGLIESLDVVVITADGYERGFSSWSGGEQMRLDIAIRLGLLALSGAEMGILILDEPGNLDESGKADLIALLDSVLALGIERVLLVSHDPDLREAFDQVIEIEVTPDGGSRVVGAVGAEVVAV